MIKIPFSNLPDTTTPINDTNLNDLQDNVEDVFNGSVTMGNIKTTGAELRGNLNLKEGDLLLSTPSSNSNDSRDIVFNYGNGNEKARLWTENEMSSSVSNRIQMRSYTNNGTLLEQSQLSLLNDIRITKCSATITVPANALAKYDIASITVPTGYKLVGVIPRVNGFGDQWLVSLSYYSNKIVAMVQSKYNGELTSSIECFVIFFKDYFYDKVITNPS